MTHPIDRPENRQAQAAFIRQWRHLPLEVIRQYFAAIGAAYRFIDTEPRSRVTPFANISRALAILLCYKDGVH